MSQTHYPKTDTLLPYLSEKEVNVKRTKWYPFSWLEFFSSIIKLQKDTRKWNIYIARRFIRGTGNLRIVENGRTKAYKRTSGGYKLQEQKSILDRGNKSTYCRRHYLSRWKYKVTHGTYKAEEQLTSSVLERYVMYRNVL